MKRAFIGLASVAFSFVHSSHNHHTYSQILENTVNPFDETSHEMFVNPWFAQEVQASKSLSDTQKSHLKNVPAAFWVDTQSAIS